MFYIAIVGSYGNSAVVHNNNVFAFQRHIAHLKPNKDIIEPYFLSIMLNSNLVKKQADALSRGIAQKTVNLTQLKEFKIINPDKSYQIDFLKIM
jgi:type I restriction enzyme, S subunit